MEKTVSIRNANITFSIWDLGGQREFINMLPLVCNDAAAILFMFDLSRIATLNNVKEWYAPFPSKFFCSVRLTPRDRYRQARGFNKTAVAILVGTKYDTFASFSPEEQAELTKQARRYAKAMKAPLIFSSSSHSINVHKVRAAWVPADPAPPLTFFHSPPLLSARARRCSRSSWRASSTSSATSPRSSRSASPSSSTDPPPPAPGRGRRPANGPVGRGRGGNRRRGRAGGGGNGVRPAAAAAEAAAGGGGGGPTAAAAAGPVTPV
jgi:hypothetical protein